jgi:hypothetical protein
MVAFVFVDLAREVLLKAVLFFDLGLLELGLMAVV